MGGSYDREADSFNIAVSKIKVRKELEARKENAENL